MNVLTAYIPRQLPLIALVSTLFITYPNVVWIPWNLARLNAGEAPGFWIFFLFRMIYFYGLFYLQLRYNMQRIANTSFMVRFGKNFLYTLVGCAAFVGLSYGLPLVGIQTGYVGNILLFQFFVACLLCTFIGYIYVLYDSQRAQEQEIERLRIENLQSRCDALANQINPHFFFNSLNGISSLVRKGNNDNTLLYVTKLSDIFRYILQSDKRGLVTVGEELAFIRSFMHVMEVRFANKQTMVYLKDGTQYPYAKTLEQVMALLRPSRFLRANKQYIIARDSVKEITTWFDSRLLITMTVDTPEPIYISKNRATEFKTWMVEE